jgi:phosphoribosylaminoimidazole-succinocarboxamide synthase
VKNKKNNILYEGKTKNILSSENEGTLILHYKDEVLNRKDYQTHSFTGKGSLNSRISENLMTRLNNIGVKTHFIKNLNMKEQLVLSCEVIPLIVKVRNVARGRLTTSLGIEEGAVLPEAIIEFHLKNHELRNPLMNDDHIYHFNISYEYELKEIKRYAYRINDYLLGLFNALNVRLVDIELEFGRQVRDGMEYIILIDEITPDTCRLWDMTTNKVLDSDALNIDENTLSENYIDIAKRLKIILD